MRHRTVLPVETQQAGMRLIIAQNTLGRVGAAAALFLSGGSAVEIVTAAPATAAPAVVHEAHARNHGTKLPKVSVATNCEGTAGNLLITDLSDETAHPFSAVAIYKFAGHDKGRINLTDGEVAQVVYPAAWAGGNVEVQVNQNHSKKYEIFAGKLSCSSRTIRQSKTAPLLK